MNPITYNISDTYNDLISKSGIEREIRRESGIKVSLNRVEILASSSIFEVHFNDDLPADQKTLLDSIVANHKGAVIETSFKKDGFNNLVVSPVAPSGVKVTKISFNFCDKTTWYSNAVLVENVVMVDSGNHTLFTLPTSEIVIDVTNYKIFNEHSTEISSKKALVYLNGVLQVENKPGTNSGGSYSRDYTTGSVTFNNALNENDAVLSTHYVLNTPGNSADIGNFASLWKINPSSGTIWRFQEAEVQFTEDISITDTIVFSLWGAVGKDPRLTPLVGVLPDNTMICLGETRYNTMWDFIDEANGAYNIKKTNTVTPTFRDCTKDIRVYRWDYAGVDSTSLNSSYGNEFRVYLLSDTPLSGTKATATLYGIEEEG